MSTTTTNRKGQNVTEKRVCGCTIEGFGEYQTRWNDYEIKCVECGKWSREYGEVSIVDDNGDERDICNKCAAELTE